MRATHEVFIYLGCITKYKNPDSKVHGANMGPTWVLSAPDGNLCGWYRLNVLIWATQLYLFTLKILRILSGSCWPFWMMSSGQKSFTKLSIARNTCKPGIMISIIKIRQSWDNLILIMRISILVRQHLDVETTPCGHSDYADFCLHWFAICQYRKGSCAVCFISLNGADLRI